MNKTVIVIDAGGRGAALVDAYAKSPEVGKIIAIPGNDLTPFVTSKPVEIHTDLKTTSVSEIVEITKANKTDLIDVAQDNAVEAGVADALIKEGFHVIGPTKSAGQIEWDKAWARDFMKKYDIPTPLYKACHSKEEGIEFLKKHLYGKWFVKAAGLAEGKGAIPAENNNEAEEAISEMAKFGEAGKSYVIEEWLQGEEFSMFSITDGKTVKIIGSAQDHKRINDGDMGPNTGGMGCSSPPLVLTPDLQKQAEEIIKKAIAGLSQEGRVYKGILYLGGIVTGGKVNVIEFNARWGDPEAEVLIPGIETDMYELAMAVANQTLDQIELKTDGKARVAVAAASKGYPIDYSEAKGKQIFGIEELLKNPLVKLYGAGVRVVENKFFINGGRLFYVVGEGKNVKEAREKAYKALSEIQVEEENLHYRHDIGWRDLKRL